MKPVTKGDQILPEQMEFTCRITSVKENQVTIKLKRKKREFYSSQTRDHDLGNIIRSSENCSIDQESAMQFYTFLRQRNYVSLMSQHCVHMYICSINKAVCFFLNYACTDKPSVNAIPLYEIKKYINHRIRNILIIELQ